MIFLLLLCVIIAFSLTKEGNIIHTHKQRILWISTFLLYILYTIITHSYVENPSTTYFISIDQTTFYNTAIDLSKYNISQIFHICFSEFSYSDCPSAWALFGTLARIGRTLGETDILLFLKFHVAFLASLIPIFIYKIMLIYNQHIPNLHKKLLIFAVVSPLLIHSCQLLRDIHICLLFTIMVYIALRPNQPLRYLWLILLMAITYTFRIENGLFSATIIAIPLYRTYRKGGYIKKAFILSIFCIFCFFAMFSILNVMNRTISGYAELTSEAASTSSLGNKLNLLPTPLAEFAKAGFSQLMPFPIWVRLTETANYTYLRIVECLFPFYWIPIWLSLFYGWWKYRKYWDKDLLAIFYISILYLVLNSAGEFNTRRLMAVYPMLLICFLTLQQQFNLRKQKMNKFSAVLLIFLHIAYSVIK